jgi:hypothetical protein
MHRTRTIGGAIILATGLVWIGQGSGLVRGGSFMVDDPLWIWLGLLAVAVGVGFIVFDLRRGR